MQYQTITSLNTKTQLAKCTIRVFLSQNIKLKQAINLQEPNALANNLGGRGLTASGAKRILIQDSRAA